MPQPDLATITAAAPRAAQYDPDAPSPRLFVVGTYCIEAREPTYIERKLLVARDQADFETQALTMARAMHGLDDDLEEGEEPEPTPPLVKHDPIQYPGQPDEPYYYGDYSISTDSAVIWFAEVRIPGS